jgi:hypothetical protein
MESPTDLDKCAPVEDGVTTTTKKLASSHLGEGIIIDEANLSDENPASSAVAGGKAKKRRNKKPKSKRGKVGLNPTMINHYHAHYQAILCIVKTRLSCRVLS